MQTETYTSPKYLLLYFHFYLLKKYFVFESVMAMYKNYFKSLIINKKIFLLMIMIRYNGCAGVAVTSCKPANDNTWTFKFFMRRCYRIRGSLNSAETKLSNGVNSHCFGIRGGAASFEILSLWCAPYAANKVRKAEEESN